MREERGGALIKAAGKTERESSEPSQLSRNIKQAFQKHVHPVRNTVTQSSRGSVASNSATVMLYHGRKKTVPFEDLKFSLWD